jgi:hypothetical protein
MRSVLFAVALATLAAAPARAGRILFATEASENAVDGFCVNGDGSLEPEPLVRIETAGSRPRRLVVKADPATGKDGVLYVVESDRVEAFRIGEHGRLAPNGAIGEDPSMGPQDVAVSDDGQIVYVPQNGRRRIAAYTLDADGRLPQDFSSCLNGPFGPATSVSLVRNGASTSPSRSSADVSRSSTSCPTATAAPARRQLETRTGATSPARSPNGELLTPGAFVISDDDVVYVESLANRRILAFQLTDGLFESPKIKKTGSRSPHRRCARWSRPTRTSPRSRTRSRSSRRPSSSSTTT